MPDGWTLKTTRLLRVGIAAVILLAGILAWRPLVLAIHHQRARRCLRVQENEGALEQLRAALRVASGRPETHLLLARTHRRLGNFERVALFLRRATELAGETEQVKREKWLLAAQSGHLRQAEPHLADLLMDPRHDGADICEAYVQAYCTNFRVDDAFRLLEAWEKDYPLDARPHFARASLCQAMGMQPKAVQAYRRGLEIDPGNTTMRYRLAGMLADVDELDEVASLLTLCVKENPDDPAILAAMADSLAARGDPVAAGDLLEKLLDKAPDHFEGLRLLGEIELQQDRFQEALSHLQAAVSLRPYDTSARIALGRTLRAMGQLKEAKPHFDFVAAAEPKLAQLARQIRSVVDRPDDPRIRYQIGAALLEYGSPEEGAKWLRTVLEIDPDHQATHRALAAYSQATDDWRASEYRRLLGREED